MLNDLAKIASVLDNSESEGAKQASIAIDHLLGYYAKTAAKKPDKKDKELDDALSDMLSDVNRKLDLAYKKMRKACGVCKKSDAPSAKRLMKDLTDFSHRIESLCFDMDHLKCSGGLVSNAMVCDHLTQIANDFDKKSMFEAADILTAIVKEAADLPDYPSRLETRQDLYDAKKHNQETMVGIVEREIDANRKEHHLEGHRPGGHGALQTRYDPELPGVPLLRVSDGVYQSQVTKKVYNFNEGWSDESGERRPGGSLAHQTPQFMNYNNPYRLFEDRARLSKKRR